MVALFSLTSLFVAGSASADEATPPAQDNAAQIEASTRTGGTDVNIASATATAESGEKTRLEAAREKLVATIDKLTEGKDSKAPLTSSEYKELTQAIKEVKKAEKAAE